MDWTTPFLKNDYEAEGTFDGGTYRAWIGCGFLPHGWKARVQIWIHGNYYCATKGSGLDGIPMAQIWCEAALAQVLQLAERLET